MNDRILGIDICDMGTTLTYYSEEKTWKFPTIICKAKDSGKWFIGEEAYEMLLSGKGIITDKLLTMLSKEGSATLNDIKYSSRDIFRYFLKAVIEKTLEEGDAYPTEIVISIPDPDKTIALSLIQILKTLKFSENGIHIVSRSECFIYYMMSQPQELHNNNVGMFSLEDNSLIYWEMQTERRGKSIFVFAEKKLMDESFNLDILGSEAGCKLADKILLSCAQRLLKNKVLSCIILTGKGFENREWAVNFMKFICNRRKVFVDDEVFSRGAGFRGADLINDKPIFRFLPICDGRAAYSVFIDVTKNDRVIPYPLVSAGDTWYDHDSRVELIPKGVSVLELNVVPMENKQRRVIRIPLDFLPERPARTTVISVVASFETPDDLTVTVRDMGFGELFPAENAYVTQEVRLWD